MAFAPNAPSSRTSLRGGRFNAEATASSARLPGRHLEHQPLPGRARSNPCNEPSEAESHQQETGTGPTMILPDGWPYPWDETDGAAGGQQATSTGPSCNAPAEAAGRQQAVRKGPYPCKMPAAAGSRQQATTLQVPSAESSTSSRSSLTRKPPVPVFFQGSRSGMPKPKAKPDTPRSSVASLSPRSPPWSPRSPRGKARTTAPSDAPLLEVGILSGVSLSGLAALVLVL